MKLLLILRHAKSSWKDPDLDDHDRPLNKRGRRDAPRMGRLLRKEDLLPDLILSSTAVRARMTAEMVADASRYRGPLEFMPHIQREMIGVVGSQAFKSSDQNPVDLFLWGQCTGGIGGENSNLMFPGQPLADVPYVFFAPTDMGKVAGAYLSYLHFRPLFAPQQCPFLSIPVT